MYWFWPFNPPHVPESIAGRLSQAAEAVYWVGVKDGVLVTAIVGLLLFVLLSNPKHES